MESRSVFYDSTHIDIVMSGIPAISAVLLGVDTKEKESVLLCLDRFLDPWFGYKLPYEKEIVELIQHVIITPNTKGVKEDALQLLTNYFYPPFEILQNNLDRVEDDLISHVMRAINLENS